MKELIEKLEILIKECNDNAQIFEEEKMSASYHASKGMAYAYGVILKEMQSQAIQALQQNDWIKVEERLPFCYERGNWDGLRSHQVLCKDKDGTCYIGLVYEGILDGSKFADWYDSKGWELKNIVEWKEL